MSFTSDYEIYQPLSAIETASRFDTFFDVFGQRLQNEPGAPQRTITLLARSPASPAAQALATNLCRFQPGTIAVGIIFAQIAPVPALDYVVQAVRKSCMLSPELVIRWAKNRALLDAHERLTLGQSLSWTGDSMRRTEDTRSAMDRVDSGNPFMFAEAKASFSAMWKASVPLPKPAFANPAIGRPAMTAGGPAPFEASPFVKQNIVRLEEYLRGRRH